MEQQRGRGESVIKVGQVWWMGTTPVWLVDRFVGDDALLARWVPVEGGLEREERYVPVESLLAHDGGWREAPVSVAEDMMRDLQPVKQ